MTGSPDLQRDGAVGILRFTTPWLFDLPTRRRFADAITDWSDDPTIRVIVIAGGPEIFVKGDVAMLATATGADLRALDLHRYWQPLLDCSKPVIAAVAGLAWGAGCELALMCDMIVADPAAQFAQPESRLGVMPGAGGAQRLLRVLGKHLTSYLLMTGNPLGATVAAQHGLVCRLSTPGAVIEEALALARQLAAQPPRSLANIKRMLAAGHDLAMSDAIRLEHETWLGMFGSADQREGMAAALAGRPPRFTGS